ncbi:hypothetical protein NLG97_g7949 [Lecanicillium saksenae]|uniref:Uncharacterized protein n=1 Tax=Lecanicillium saksenae TaxID=468837 RepID=A0ACC1QM80_9HYPO|nr:hypothetical protein NLG97_g7949 [Lecanicillium saksenae]
MSAVRYLRDREHPNLPPQEGDPNLYILGELCGHNVVLAWLSGNQGKGAAAIVATNLSRSFPAVKWRFMVGIGGGVPSEKHDIRLGDVVISMPEGHHGGVVQYDLGKDEEENFKLKGLLLPLPTQLRNAVELMRSNHMISDNKIEEFLQEMLQKGSGLSVYKRPPSGADVLFTFDYRHETNHATCEGCHKGMIIHRRPRSFDRPYIHYGLVASGDRVMKRGVKRQATVQNVGDILCFEMEAAGIATEYPCMVIRGISDYADSHKNDGWHYYAAATAAATAKELLSCVPGGYETGECEKDARPHGRSVNELSNNGK